MSVLTSPPTTIPPRRAALGLLAGLVGLIVLGSAAAFVVRVLPGVAVTGVDAEVTGYLVRNRTPWLTTASHIASGLADLWAVAAIVAVLGVAAGVRSRGWRLLWVPGLAGGGALLISMAVKVFTNRSRPPVESAIVDAYGMAFPSGHALRALAVYGALAWLVAAAVRRNTVRALTWAGAVIVISAVGFARVYLGVHWLTDVLAGYVLGAAWLGLVLAVSAGRLPRSRVPAAAGTGEPR